MLMAVVDDGKSGSLKMTCYMWKSTRNGHATHLRLGMGNQNRFLLRNGSEFSDPSDSYASVLINSFYWCQHVFLTVAKQWCQTHASTLLETDNEKEPWLRGRNGPKRGFNLGEMTTLLDVKCLWNDHFKKPKRGKVSSMLKHLSTQHGLKFQECHVFVCICIWVGASATASQPSSSSVTEGKYRIIRTLAPRRQAWIFLTKDN